MTEWTVERLDALPEGTVIEWLDSGVEMMAVKQDKGRWQLVRRAYYEHPEGIVADADPGSVRVVSVPIDALLEDGTVRAIARAMSDDWNPDRDPVLTAMFQDYSQTAARAAVAHITGETP